MNQMYWTDDDIQKLTDDPYKYVYDWVHSAVDHDYVAEIAIKGFARIRPFFAQIKNTWAPDLNIEKFFLLYLSTASILYMLMLGVLPWYVRLGVGGVIGYHGFPIHSAIWLTGAVIGMYFTKGSIRTDVRGAISLAALGFLAASIGPLGYYSLNWSPFVAGHVTITGCLIMACTITKAMTKHSVEHSLGLFYGVMGMALIVAMWVGFSYMSHIQRAFHCARFGLDPGSQEACYEKFVQNLKDEVKELDFKRVTVGSTIVNNLPVPPTVWNWSTGHLMSMLDFVSSLRGWFGMGEKTSGFFSAWAIILAMGMYVYTRICSVFGSRDREMSTNATNASRKGWTTTDILERSTISEWIQVVNGPGIMIFFIFCLINLFHAPMDSVMMLVIGFVSIAAGFALYSCTTRMAYSRSGVAIAAMLDKFANKDGSLIVGPEADAGIRDTIVGVLRYSTFFTITLAVVSIMGTYGIFVGCLSTAICVVFMNVTSLVYMSLVIASMAHMNLITLGIAAAIGVVIRFSMMLDIGNTKSGNAVRETAPLPIKKVSVEQPGI